MTPQPGSEANLIYEVSKSNERSILRWKLGRTVGVGGNTGKFLLGAGMEKEGGGLYTLVPVKEGINEAIKAVSLRSIVGGRAG